MKIAYLLLAVSLTGCIVKKEVTSGLKGTLDSYRRSYSDNAGRIVSGLEDGSITDSGTVNQKYAEIIIESRATLKSKLDAELLKAAPSQLATEESEGWVKQAIKEWKQIQKVTK